MRFKLEYKKPLEVGTVRIRDKFALFPVRTTKPNKDTIIWLEFYRVKEKYRSSFRRSWWAALEVECLD